MVTWTLTSANRMERLWLRTLFGKFSSNSVLLSIICTARTLFIVTSRVLIFSWLKTTQRSLETLAPLEKLLLSVQPLILLASPWNKSRKTKLLAKKNHHKKLVLLITWPRSFGRTNLVRRSQISMRLELCCMNFVPSSSLMKRMISKNCRPRFLRKNFLFRLQSTRSSGGSFWSACRKSQSRDQRLRKL